MAGRYEAVLTAAEKLHVRLLRLLTGALTCTLWTMPVLGSLGIWDLMTHGPGLSGIFLILGFLAAYVCFLGILCWMCLVCRMPVLGSLGIWDLMTHGPGLSGIFLILGFLAAYVCFLGILCWMCLVCRRLRIARRLLVWMLLWIPFLNYGLALYVRGLAKQETDHILYRISLDDVRAEKNVCSTKYPLLLVQFLNYGLALYVRGLAKQETDHILYRISLDDVRAEKNVCSTKYPLLLVHGVGFRDFHYFNYWGRIPRALKKNGARVFYGHQEAWGTVEENAGILREKIFEILRENGEEKVNIIAHSKGGLDSRYLISGLHMAPYVASLTTICTPHRGSMLADLLMKLPDFLYRGICGLMDRYFGMLGDRAPNAYVASRQLSFNEAAGFSVPGDLRPYRPVFWNAGRPGAQRLCCQPPVILSLDTGIQPEISGFNQRVLPELCQHDEMRGKLLATQYPLLDPEAFGCRERRACSRGVCPVDQFQGHP